MKKMICILLVGILTIMSACGKGAGAEQEEEKFYDCQKGFMGSLGNRISESPDGYYFLMGDYLKFADKNLEKTTFVCNKPECLHCKEVFDNKKNCDSYFNDARAVNYYNEKVYIMSFNIGKKQEKDADMIIYEVALDGSTRKAIYSSGMGMHAFCIHRGKCYVYEKKFTDAEGNASKNQILTITSFPIENPKKAKEIFRLDKYKTAEINTLQCYKNYCFFRVIGENSQSYVKKINLDTLEVTNCAEGCFWNTIGNNCMIGSEILEEDNVNYTWEEKLYEYNLNGELIKELTEKEFPVLKKNVSLECMDDKYIYFRDISYGANEVPKEEQKIYVYTYDGTEVCQVSFSEITNFQDVYPGNERYLFYYDQSDGITFYYLDKEEFGKGAKLKKIISDSTEDYLE